MTRLQWLMVHKDYSQDQCLPWPFSKFGNGYSRIKFEGKATTAHRVMCKWVHGEPPSPRYDAAHSCHRRDCINPKHLRWASKKENQADRVNNGTSNRGDRNGASKLTVDDVLFIKAHSRQDSFVLSEKYRVTEKTIRKIQRGNRWGWLTCGPERIHWEAKA